MKRVNTYSHISIFMAVIYIYIIYCLFVNATFFHCETLTSWDGYFGDWFKLSKDSSCFSLVQNRGLKPKHMSMFCSQTRNEVTKSSRVMPDRVDGCAGNLKPTGFVSQRKKVEQDICLGNVVQETFMLNNHHRYADSLRAFGTPTRLRFPFRSTYRRVVGTVVHCSWSVRDIKPALWEIAWRVSSWFEYSLYMVQLNTWQGFRIRLLYIYNMDLSTYLFIYIYVHIYIYTQWILYRIYVPCIHLSKNNTWKEYGCLPMETWQYTTWLPWK